MQIVDTLSHQRGAHAWRAGVDVLVNDDTITFPRSSRGAYTFSSLANFLAGTYNTSGFTQTFGATEVAQSSPAVGVYAQDEWKAGPAVTLNLGLRYDLQWIETVRLDADNLAPRMGRPGRRPPRGAACVRGGAGLYFDRVPLRAAANALLSAGNTTDLTQLRQTNVSLSPAQAGAPVFPAVLAAAVPSSTLVNFTTMDRGLQHAYSRQASVEFEQQLGARTTVSAGYQYVRGVDLLMQVNQNVPSCAAERRQQRLPPERRLRQRQPVLVGGGVVVPRPAGLARRPAVVVGPDAGELHAVQIAEQRGRSVLQLADRSARSGEGLGPLGRRSAAPARRGRVVSAAGRGGQSGWTSLGRGLELSGLMQDHSALPFNITSGVTTLQGTAGRPIVDGRSSHAMPAAAATS